MKPQATQAPHEHNPGRSVRDPTRPLGEDILRTSRSTTAPTKEDFHDRATHAAEQAAANPGGVAERAKVIGVLRKAEEFMSTSNPAPDTDADVRRALELACGRLGLTYREYRALVASDPELVDLEGRVIEDARARWGRAPAATVAPPTVVERPEDEAAAERAQAESVFARLFVPIDYSMDSHRALAVALALRRTQGSVICLFHAAESTGSDDWLAGIGSPAVGGDWIAESKQRLQRFVTHVAPGEDHDIEVRACIGAPVTSLCKEAHRWGATLVVAVASVEPAFVRSPAEKIVHELRLPVLIIPSA
jgi:nucleotide-binding universal stress UspA family protein